MQSCWFGLIRNDVGGAVVNVGTFADPDANEIVSNTIGASLVCLGNSPHAQFGDSSGAANTAGTGKFGECADL